MTAEKSVAYLADGKLYLRSAGGDAELLESTFVQELLDRAERQRERHNWKSDGMAWNVRAGGFSPFGANTQLTDVRRVTFRSLSGGHNAGEFFYSIATDSVGGVFQLELPGRYERRLVHRNMLEVTDMALHPQQRLLALAVRNGDGTANIATMEVERRGIHQVTEGDCVDEAPAWVPGKAKEVIYQSAGVARNPHGFPQAYGAYSLHQLDLDGGSHRRVLHDDAHDHLLPRVGQDGQLLFIRRPYQAFQKVSPLKMVEDALCFPFRVGRTAVHVLHFLSVAFSGKPLISAGGPRQQGPVPEQMMLWGRLIQAHKSIRGGTLGQGESLVPGDWQLVARAENGSEQVLAKHVVCYDLAADGSLVYSDGRRVMALARDGQTTCLCEGRLISRIALVA